LKTVAGIFVLTGCFASFAAGQTVVVDMTHPTNHFVPKETLGAGVDRIAADAIDKDLVQPNLDRALEAGWQPVTYRQNTELAVEAVALESARHLERRKRQRLLHRFGNAYRDASLFLWL